MGDPPHGSNAFAVGGGRTTSGLPLIGADPHRVFEVPGTDVAPAGVAVTANDRTDVRWDVLSSRFAPGWRRDRIASLVAGGGIDVAAAAAVLVDEDNAAGGPLLALLLQLPELPAPSRRLVDQLRDWDGSMQAGSVAAGAFGAVRDALVAAVVAHPLLEPDVANTRSLALFQRLGGELGPVAEIPAPMPDLPAKTAQFVFLSRPAQASASVASSTKAGSSSLSP